MSAAPASTYSLSGSQVYTAFLREITLRSSALGIASLAEIAPCYPPSPVLHSYAVYIAARGRGGIPLAYRRSGCPLPHLQACALRLLRFAQRADSQALGTLRPERASGASESKLRVARFVNENLPRRYHK